MDRHSTTAAVDVRSWVDVATITKPDCAWQTIMGGYVQCGFDVGQPDPSQQSTKRLVRWSNPNLTYQGHVLGATTHRMADALNITMPIAAAWRPDSPPPPGAPGWMNVSSAYCQGLNVANWSAVSGVVEYRVFGSYSPAFTSPVLIYSTVSTNAWLNVGFGETLYVRVKACNGGGCSGYSAQGTAEYGYGLCL